MAEVTLFLRIDDLEKQILVEMDGVAREHLIEQGTKVKKEIVRLIHERAEVNTPGGLADSISGEVFPQDLGDHTWQGVVSSDSDHALFFEEGTGLFGPRKSFIFPRAGKFMIFRHRKLGRVVYAQKVSGQPGKHPFRDGLEAVR